MHTHALGLALTNATNYFKRSKTKHSSKTSHCFRQTNERTHTHTNISSNRAWDGGWGSVVVCELHARTHPRTMVTFHITDTQQINKYTRHIHHHACMVQQTTSQPRRNANTRAHTHTHTHTHTHMRTHPKTHARTHSHAQEFYGSVDLLLWRKLGKLQEGPRWVLLVEQVGRAAGAAEPTLGPSRHLKLVPVLHCLRHRS